MNPRDISQMYQGVLCLYKGAPVKVIRVRDNSSVDIFRLISQSSINVPFSLENFSAPKGRIGFVNNCKNAFYVKRIPYRKYYNGLCVDNCSIQNPCARSPEYELRNFTTKDLVSPLLNEYPSFEEALELIEKGWISVAFDKQFCVTSDMRVYYKMNKIGIVKDNKISLPRKFEYLRSLIGVTYEKTF